MLLLRTLGNVIDREKDRLAVWRRLLDLTPAEQQDLTPDSFELTVHFDVAELTALRQERFQYLAQFGNIPPSVT